MGITFIAFGASIPDCFASLLVAKKGLFIHLVFSIENCYRIDFISRVWLRTKAFFSKLQIYYATIQFTVAYRKNFCSKTDKKFYVQLLKVTIHGDRDELFERILFSEMFNFTKNLAFN